MRTKRWSKAEIDFLREALWTMHDHIIAAELSRITGRIFTRKAVTLKRQKLGFVCGDGYGPRVVLRTPDKEEPPASH